MTGTVSMLRAELRKILSRGSGRAGLLIAALLPALVVLVLRAVSGAQVQAVAQGRPVPLALHADARAALSWTLRARNFYVLPLVLLLVAVQLTGGEARDGTLRPLLVRPVSRPRVLAVKLAALAAYAGFTLVASLLPALGLGLGLLGGGDRPVAPVLAGWAMSWASDLGLVTLGTAVALFAPSTAGAVVGTVLFLMADTAARLLLEGAVLVGVTSAEPVARFLPGNALAAWEGWQDGFDPVATGGLVVLILTCLAVALVRFRRMDVS